MIPRDELPAKLHAEIKKHSKAGEKFFSAGNYTDALAEYTKAWKLIPDPPEHWNASTWVLTAIGDCYFMGRRYDLALDAFNEAVQCPGGLGNPFIHLRLGQCQFELGKLDRAADELIRAYAIEGNKIFRNDDKKYLAFLATRADDIEA